MKQAQTYFFLGLLSFVLAGCIGKPPLRTYTIARTALESARRSEGSKAAAEDMHKAEESFRRGEFFYRNRDFSGAADEFEETIKFAEEAENTARLNPRGD